MNTPYGASQWAQLSSSASNLARPSIRETASPELPTPARYFFDMLCMIRDSPSPGLGRRALASLRDGDVVDGVRGRRTH